VRAGEPGQRRQHEREREDGEREAPGSHNGPEHAPEHTIWPVASAARTIRAPRARFAAMRPCARVGPSFDGPRLRLFPVPVHDPALQEQCAYTRSSENKKSMKRSL
jgi:hypothetical protein